MPLKWNSLKINRCPKCKRDFSKGLKVESNMQPTMLTHSCGFQIRETRMNEIVMGMVEEGIDKE